MTLNLLNLAMGLICLYVGWSNLVNGNRAFGTIGVIVGVANLLMLMLIKQP